ncbi:MAG: ABC transporter ATP-binding protein [Bacillota bacterium]|nr:ABC transporter ATP-binding protein [Bacillota bacterium]
MKDFYTLKDFFLKHKWRYLLGIIWLIIVDSLQLLTPRILGLFTDALLEPGVRMGILHKYILLIISIAAGMAIFRYLWRLYIIGTARLLEKYLRDLLFNHLQGLSPKFYLQHKTGELMAHLTNDINAVRTSFGFSIVLLVDAIFLSVFTIIFMFFTADLRLTLLALIPLPFLALGTQKLGLGVFNRFMKVQEAFGALTETTQENISAMRVVQAFALDEVEKNRFRKSSHNYIKQNFLLYRMWAFYDPLIYICSFLSFIIVLIYGGNLVMEGQITVGDFVAFNGYLVLLTWPMLALGWVINITQRGRASMQRINHLLQKNSEILEPSQPIFLKKEELQNDIILENITFNFPDDPNHALSNISLTISNGKTTAIAGRTGSGKSTLIYLILRLFEPNEGRILVGRHELNRIPLKTWREQIGYVPQDNFIFSATIAENIAFICPGASLEEIKEVSKLVALDQEIEHFPEKYDTMVGERGVTLSGGQQQRVALARALLARPRLLILDDALSSVDITTEEQIINNLQDDRMNVTMLISSHRLKVLRRADKVLVFEKGRLVEEGNHRELLQKKGQYFLLCEQQLWEEIL